MVLRHEDTIPNLLLLPAGYGVILSHTCSGGLWTRECLESPSKTMPKYAEETVCGICFKTLEQHTCPLASVSQLKQSAAPGAARLEAFLKSYIRSENCQTSGERSNILMSV